MNCIVLADIHSNVDALEAVLNDASSESYDEVWLLGDVTGYGPDPGRVIRMLRSIPQLKVIRGNHDRIVSKISQPVGFNPSAIQAAFKNMNDLEEVELGWLKALPEKLRPTNGMQIVHGSPVNPDDYLTSLKSTELAFSYMGKQNLNTIFFGHTHFPAVYEFLPSTDQYSDVDLEFGKALQLTFDKGERYLINPGSVGQPRDGNWRASYMRVRTEGKDLEIVCRRVEYNIIRCKEKMSDKGYPDSLIKRLDVGF